MAYEVLPVSQNDPRVVFCYRIIVQGITSQGALSVDGLETETDQIDHRLGNEETFVYQVRGLTKAPALVIVVPKSQSREWQQWRDDTWSRGGGAEPDPSHKRKVIIEELDPIDRKTVLERHIYKDCWIYKLTHSKLDSMASEIATLTIELRHKGPKYEND